MKTVILAGGLGTRIGEETHLKPKPMIDIGNMPIIWHIMKLYSHYGFYDFILCCGYKGYQLKEYFSNYYLHHSDVTFDFGNENRMELHNCHSEPWRVTLVDTGLETMTGGRVRRIRPYVGDEPFMLTYGDGVADVDIPALVRFHQESGKTATITAVQPGGRFGVLDIDERDRVVAFKEKSREDGGWVNGGFMVFQPEIFDELHGDATVLEREPLERLAAAGQLQSFRHRGFWQCMDTQRDRLYLEELWAGGNAPWKLW
jgi:glucose-1-phosphate cytidylyltransferase